MAIIKAERMPTFDRVQKKKKDEICEMREGRRQFATINDRLR